MSRGRADPGARRVEIVLDLVCVHAYRGFVRLLRAVERRRAEGFEVAVGILPFQLMPEASYAAEPLFDVHERTRGEKAAREIRDDASLGAEDGLELNLGRALFVNTFEAHRALAQASAHGRGEQLAERLFRAYFTDGLHIGDADTLARLARETGVTLDGGGAAELTSELGRVRRLGVGAPPVFRFGGGSGGGHVLEGEQPEEALYASLGG